MTLVKFESVETDFGHINFQLMDNSSFCFYGPAKMGKTHLLLLAGGVAKPREGKVILCDLDTRIYPKKVRSLTGVCALKDVTPLYDSLTVQENLEFQARISKVKKVQQQVLQQRKEFNLAQLADIKAEKINALESLRLGLAMATINNPKVLLIDEPEFRLSTEQRKIIPLYLQKLNDQGYAVIFTTCDRALAESANSYIDLTLEGRERNVIYSSGFNRIKKDFSE